jgi:hypothetical protein
LSDGDLADEVDLELLAEVVDREQLERSSDRGPGVVDEAGEPRCAAIGLDALGRRRDRIRIGDVEDDRLEAVGGDGRERRAILVAANRRENAVAASVEAQRRRPADPGRGAGDEERRQALVPPARSATRSAPA